MFVAANIAVIYVLLVSTYARWLWDTIRRSPARTHTTRFCSDKRTTITTARPTTRPSACPFPARALPPPSKPLKADDD